MKIFSNYKGGHEIFSDLQGGPRNFLGFDRGATKIFEISSGPSPEILYDRSLRINVNATDSDEEPEQNRYDAAERFEEKLKRKIAEKKPAKPSCKYIDYIIEYLQCHHSTLNFIKYTLVCENPFYKNLKIMSNLKYHLSIP